MKWAWGGGWRLPAFLCQTTSSPGFCPISRAHFRDRKTLQKRVHHKRPPLLIQHNWERSDLLGATCDLFRLASSHQHRHPLRHACLHSQNQWQKISTHQDQTLAPMPKLIKLSFWRISGLQNPLWPLSIFSRLVCGTMMPRTNQQRMRSSPIQEESPRQKPRRRDFVNEQD